MEIALFLFGAAQLVILLEIRRAVRRMVPIPVPVRSPKKVSKVIAQVLGKAGYKVDSMTASEAPPTTASYRDRMTPDEFAKKAEKVWMKLHGSSQE